MKRFCSSLATLAVLGLAATTHAGHLAPFTARGVATGFVIFATGLESSHLLAGAPLEPLVMNWVADLGGLSAVAVPIVVERYRRRFPPRFRTSADNPP